MRARAGHSARTAGRRGTESSGTGTRDTRRLLEALCAAASSPALSAAGQPQSGGVESNVPMSFPRSNLVYVSPLATRAPWPRHFHVCSCQAACRLRTPLRPPSPRFGQISLSFGEYLCALANPFGGGRRPICQTTSACRDMPTKRVPTSARSQLFDLEDGGVEDKRSRGGCGPRLHPAFEPPP